MSPVSTRTLWISFVVLFAVVALASVLPVTPIVFVFPLWAVVVLAAALASVGVGVAASRTGWPAVEGAEVEP